MNTTKDFLKTWVRKTLFSKKGNPSRNAIKTCPVCRKATTEEMLEI